MPEKPFSITHKNFFLSPAFFGLLALILSLSTIAIWQFRETQLLNNLAAATAAEARHHASATELHFHFLYHDLELLAESPPRADPQDFDEWSQLGESLLARHDSLEGLLWVDSNDRVQHSLSQPLDPGPVGEFSSQLETSPGQIFVRVPSRDPVGDQGEVLGLVQVEALMAPITLAADADFQFQVADRSRVLFYTDHWETVPEGWITRTAINLESNDTLELNFGPAETSVHAARVNARMSLWFGFGISAVTLTAVFFSQTTFKRNLAHQARYQNLYNASQDALFITDLEGRFLDANPAALVLVGREKAELKTLAVSDLVFNPDGYSIDRYHHALGFDGIFWEELRHKDGRKVTVELSLSLLTEPGKPNQVLGIARDISRRKRSENLVQLRLALMELAQQAAEAELIQKTVDEVCELTDSEIAFFHLVDEDQDTLSLQAWSTGTKENFCQAQGVGLHYPIEQAGVWTDCIRARAPVIHNDYAALPHRKGLPEGHPNVVRELVVPIFRAEKIVAILGVGNKRQDYTQEDADAVTYIADVCWEIIEKKSLESQQVQQHQFLQAIFANAPLLMILVDDQWQIHQASGFAAQFVESTTQEVTGLRCGEALRCLNALDDPAGCGFGPHCQDCTIRNTILTSIENQSAFQQIQTSLPMVVADQEQELHLLLSSTPLSINGQTMALVTMVDVTDLQQARSQLQGLLHQQETLNQLTLALSRRNNALALFQTLFEHLCPLLSPQSFTAYTYDPALHQAAPIFSAVDGRVLDVSDETPISLDENPHTCLNQVFLSQAPHYNPGSTQKKQPACFCLPLTVMSDVIGMMRITNPNQVGFSQGQRDFLDSIARITAAMLQNIQLIDSLEGLVRERTAELEQKIHSLDRSQKAMLYMVEDLNQTSKALRTERQMLTLTNQELEAFSYSVSHDLRAPLRHINGYIDLLLKRYQEDLPQKAQHYLVMISEAVDDMNSLINSLLTFSKTSRQEMHLTRVAMTALVEEAQRSLAPEYQDRSVAWDLQPLPEAQGDRYLLKLVWQNLLSNALKFTREKETARIEIGAEETADEIIYHVRDNGTGFDMQYGHKLFNVFQRLHSPVEFEGTGVGLANLRRIIQRHGGRTWAEGQPGKGAVFYFSLPKV